MKLLSDIEVHKKSRMVYRAINESWHRGPSENTKEQGSIFCFFTILTYNFRNFTLLLT